MRRAWAPATATLSKRAVAAVADEALKADALVDEALAAGLDGSHPVTVQAKMLRLELLKVKGDIERELGTFRPQLLTLRSRRALGRGPRHLARSLGAPGAGAARRAVVR
jgi:hypothetical protein